MLEKGIDTSSIVINNPKGPCMQTSGCDDVLGPLLGNKSLTVYWPDGEGGFEKRTYGKGRPNRKGK